MWKDFLVAKRTVLPYFQCRESDCADIVVSPAPVFVPDLTLRCGMINNLKILRFDSKNVRMALSQNTVLGMFNLEHCVNIVIAGLLPLLTLVDVKLAQFMHVASANPRNIFEVIRNSPLYSENDLLLCELLALFVDVNP